MHFKTKIILRMFTGILAVQGMSFGQHYFSSVLPINIQNGDARSMGMGQGMQPLIRSFSNHSFTIRIDFDMQSVTETRSFPIIDMFDDIVTENVYVVNRPKVYSMPWSLSYDAKKWVHMPATVSLTRSIFWDFRYDYTEEVRSSLGPGVYNRDPVAGYHIFRRGGMIHSTRFSAAAQPVAFLNIGISLETLNGRDMTQEYGVHVLRTDEALAADSTDVKEFNISAERINRWALDLDYILDESLTLSLSMKSPITFTFKTDGFIPSLDERTQLPGLLKADSLSEYKIPVPGEYSLGFTARLTNKIKTIANGNITYADWSHYDQVRFSGTESDTVSYNYEPAWSFHVGVEHWILGQTPFRFGFSYIGSPLGEEFEQTRITLGTGWTFERFTLDIGSAFGRTEYRYTDLFIPKGQEALHLEEVRDATFSLKASLTYLF